MIDIDHDNVSLQLDKIEASATFIQASRLVAFLRYIVEAELNGTGSQLSQYRIALEVMGRGQDFDPASDSCVRVEAGRLRAKLREYYETEGIKDRIKFTLPKGRYNPDISTSQASAENNKLLSQKIRFCKTHDNVSLAYALSGQQAPVLVKAANWLSHLEYDCSSPIWSHWWLELSNRFKLLRYDERGCGLSDWEVGDFTFDDWVADLDCVIESAGVDKFALLGISQGASVAINYAVANPDRVSHLILYGGFIQGRLRRNPPQKAEAKMLEDLIKLGWGRSDPAFRRVFASLFAPESSSVELDAFDELQKVSTSTANALRFIQAFNNVDVLELARKVNVPTLIMHARDEAEIPFSQARLMATTIPNAQLITLESRNHILGSKEPAWKSFLKEIELFVNN